MDYFLTQILHWKRGIVNTPDTKCCNAKGAPVNPKDCLGLVLGNVSDSNRRFTPMRPSTPHALLRKAKQLGVRPFGRILSFGQNPGLKVLRIIIFLFMCIVLSSKAMAELDLKQLPEEDVIKVKNLIEKLAPFIKERDAKENLATLTFEELYAPLNEEERAFLKQFEQLDAQKLGVKIPFRGMATGEEELAVIKGQKMRVEGEEKELPPQFLPKNVYEQYLKMMEGMQADLGKCLLIESGYRSSAYQLYLFVFYLQNHEYSIAETVKFVALPGFSEHGSPEYQAIDFINKQGINGEDNAQEFEVLPEYAWLLKNASQYGFVLSYPKDAQEGITFEPWHWRYESHLNP